MGWVLQSAKKGAPFEARLWPRETKFQMEGNYLNQEMMPQIKPASKFSL